MRRRTRGLLVLAVASAALSGCGSSHPLHSATHAAPSTTSTSVPAASSSTTPPPATSTTQPPATSTTLPAATVMNPQEIAAGNYTSLMGTWTEEAHAVNAGGGTGIQWTTGGTDTLAVSSSEIDNNTEGMTIQGQTLTSGSASDALSFQVTGGYAEATLVDQDVAINWDVGFYPKNSVNLDSKANTNNGVQLDDSKNTIYIWTSNDGYAQVFSQTAAATTSSASSTVPQTAQCLTDAGFTTLLATPGTTVTQIDYCGGGVALTEADDCSNSAGVCNAIDQVFQAVDDHWVVSSRDAVCDYAHNGANSPFPSTYQWFCNGD